MGRADAPADGLPFLRAIRFGAVADHLRRKPTVFCAARDAFGTFGTCRQFLFEV